MSKLTEKLKNGEEVELKKANFSSKLIKRIKKLYKKAEEESKIDWEDIKKIKFK